MEKYWEALRPHHNIFELTVPREISGNIAMPKPVIAMVSNYLNSKKGYDFTEEQIRNFNAIPSV